jgi:hypothetical protein
MMVHQPRLVQPHDCHDCPRVLVSVLPTNLGKTYWSRMALDNMICRTDFRLYLKYMYGTRHLMKMPAKNVFITEFKTCLTTRIA